MRQMTSMHFASLFRACPVIARENFNKLLRAPARLLLRLMAVMDGLTVIPKFSAPDPQ